MSKKYIKNGEDYRLVPSDAITVLDDLPVGYYTTQVTITGEIYLTIAEEFEVPKKLYGTTLKYTDRILNTFNARGGSLGAMFAGQKGSGKTMLARNIAIEATKQGMPVILVTSGLKGDNFNSFIQMIEQRAVVVFDEFEKNYNTEEQELFLSLFDGTFQTNKLFLFTVNNMYRVQEHMRNRPGRIYYMIEFDNLEEEFVREYTEDNLIRKERFLDVISIYRLFEAFSVDMLKAVIEEINMYDESIPNILKLMNVKPTSESIKYEIKLTSQGEEFTVTNPSELNFSPLKVNSINLGFMLKEETEDEDEEWRYFNIDTSKNFVEFDKEKGSFEYMVNVDNKPYNIIFSPKKITKMDYGNFF